MNPFLIIGFVDKNTNLASAHCLFSTNISAVFITFPNCSFN